MKFTSFYNEYDHFMASLIAEATLDKMQKKDQEAVKSGDASKIKKRIDFWNRALKGDELQPNGKPYKDTTCRPYIKFLENKMKEAEEASDGSNEAENNEANKKEDRDKETPIEVEVTVNVNEE